MSADPVHRSVAIFDLLLGLPGLLPKPSLAVVASPHLSTSCSYGDCSDIAGVVLLSPRLRQEWDYQHLDNVQIKSDSLKLCG